MIIEELETLYILTITILFELHHSFILKHDYFII